MLAKDTYAITYQYSPSCVRHQVWRTSIDLDFEHAEMLLRMLLEMGRNCRVRHNATGRVVEVGIADKEPLTLLHLFFKRISDRNGKDTEDG